MAASLQVSMSEMAMVQMPAWCKLCKLWEQASVHQHRNVMHAEMVQTYLVNNHACTAYMEMVAWLTHAIIGYVRPPSNS